MSICPPRMPNMFLFVGPNGAPGAGSTIHMSECACEYMIKCIRKIQRENLRWMMAKFVDPIQGRLKTKIFTSLGTGMSASRPL